MKRIQLPPFDPAVSFESQLARHFVQCGLNADWSETAYHLSAEAITGHKPNTTSGDFYLVQDEVTQGGWGVLIRTYAPDRTDPQENVIQDQDLVEHVAEFASGAEAWAWLADPVSQAHYLLDDEPGLQAAMGITVEAPAASASSSLSPLLASPDFAAPLTAHEYGSLGKLLIEPADRPAYEYQSFHLGFGRMLVGHVHGTTEAREGRGFPGLSIPEAEALAGEIMRRWNAHATLVEQLSVTCVRLEQAMIKLQHSNGANCQELANFINADIGIARTVLAKAQEAA